MTVNYPIVSRFADRIAVVTGGAGGMGTAIADRLAAEGATVVLVDRDPRVAAVAEDIAAQDRKAIAIAADLARPEECVRVADEVLEQAGVPDEREGDADEEAEVAAFSEFLDQVDPEDFQG